MVAGAWVVKTVDVEALVVHRVEVAAAKEVEETMAVVRAETAERVAMAALVAVKEAQVLGTVGWSMRGWHVADRRSAPSRRLQSYRLEVNQSMAHRS